MLSRRTIVTGFGTAAAALAGARLHAQGAAPGPARKLILIVASGGWDTTYALDPKPGIAGVDAPEGEVREFSGIPILTHASRPAVEAFFTAWSGAVTLVRGIQVQSIIHADCAKRLLTGTASDANPDVGAITAFELGRALPAPYLVLGSTAYAGPYASIAARTGSANQLAALLGPSFPLPLDPPATAAFAMDPQEDALARTWIEARAQREIAVRGQTGSNATRLRDFVDSIDRADALRAIGDVGDLDFTRNLDVQIELAIRGLSSGIAHVVQMELGDWDTHQDNARQTERHQTFFTALAALVQRLADEPGEAAGSRMLDETVVAVVSEMGRTPRLNDDAGKDHWPVTSAVVLGGGLPGGRALGGTDDDVQALAVDLATGVPDPSGLQIQYGNFAAGLLAAVGLDPAPYLPNAEPLHALRA